MTITWYGQACFRLESKDTRVLIDPFSKELGLRPPRINDTICLVTHEHYDHNNTENIESGVLVFRGPGEYEHGGVQIVGILSYHDETQGRERGLNTIYTIRMEDITLCHLGDLGQTTLSEDQVEAIGDVDILFIPVGGKYTIGAKDAISVARQIEPRIIVPMHYKIHGLRVDIDGVEPFVKESGLTPEKVNTYKVAKKNLPQEGMKLVVFNL